MGGSKRYPEHAHRLAEEREIREARARGPLHTLTSEQLALSRMPVTVAPERSRIRGRAWVRYGDTDVRATVRILRWTDDAVGVEITCDGQADRCWIWRGACAPIDE